MIEHSLVLPVFLNTPRLSGITLIIKALYRENSKTRNWTSHDDRALLSASIRCLPEPQTIYDTKLIDILLRDTGKSTAGYGSRLWQTLVNVVSEN